MAVNGKTAESEWKSVQTVVFEVSKLCGGVDWTQQTG